MLKQDPKPRLRRVAHELVRRVAHLVYLLCVAALHPLNLLLVRIRRHQKHPRSVLHIASMSHVVSNVVSVLRQRGVKADYLAVDRGHSGGLCDYQLAPSRWPFIVAVQEFLMFWRVVAKYEIVHQHVMLTPSRVGWEQPLLKRMGRRIVVHYRGCEIRCREANMAREPNYNICQDCDYGASICRSPLHRRNQSLARRYADLELVTTPDLLEFVPRAEHFPFLAPEGLPAPVARARTWDARNGHPLRIVHVTAHPGIEGTAEIRRVIESLRARGFSLDFVFLCDIPHDQVLEEMSRADLTIGKMKMGYYANAQIEGMVLGAPTITYVRPEFITDELRTSGFILCSLDQLETTLEHYLTHPQELAAKAAIARASVLHLHDNDRIAARLIGKYEELWGAGSIASPRPLAPSLR